MVWLVHPCDPVVCPPVGEDARVVEAEDVDVTTMDKVIGQNLKVAAIVIRSNDSNIGRIELREASDEHVSPVWSFHSGVIVDAVEIFIAVEVRLHHRVVLSPCRLPAVGTPNEVKGQLEVTTRGAVEVRKKLVPKLLEEFALVEGLVVDVVGEVEVVEKVCRRCTAEGRQKVDKKCELAVHAAGPDPLNAL